MTLSTRDLEELASLAITAAVEAGEMIAEARPLEVEHKASGDSLASQVVTEIDRRSEDIIVDHLTPTLAVHEVGLLTEERNDDGSRLECDYFWCIDPLDGTLPFIEGRPGYAVSIALVARDGKPVIGVLYDPVSAATVHAIDGIGAFRNGEAWKRLPETEGEVLTVFADRSFSAHDAMDALAQQRFRTSADVRVGSGAVMNALGVLDHAPACYVKYPKASGGGSVWDFAATACVFAALGAVATDIYGQPLDLNRAHSTFMHDRGVLFASDETLAKQVRDGFSAGTSGASG